jgi:succinate dehydrogenase / fumarate reductase flavoprotein subunit
MAKRQVAVVGGGLGGLMTTMKLAEAGVHVDLFSLVPVKRSHSVCAQGGINGAVNTKGEGDSPWIHFDDTIYGGDFLANQPPVLRMCERAPAIIYLLDRMGVPFNRTPEGLIDFRRFGGTRHHRTAFSGSTTGQQLLYALDEQVRRWEVEGRVTKYEGWEFLGLILDENGVCRGLVAQDLRSMEIRAFREEAVVIATGGPGMIFKNTTNSIICTGSAASICYQQGAYYANGEFIQIHPTAIPGEDKCRLISEAVRGEGGRVWVPKDPHDSRHPRDIPKATAGTSLRRSIPPTATSCRATLPRAKSSMCASISGAVYRVRTKSTSTSPTCPASKSRRSCWASSKSTSSSWATTRAKCRCASTLPSTTRWVGCGWTTR